MLAFIIAMLVVKISVDFGLYYLRTHPQILRKQPVSH